MSFLCHLLTDCAILPPGGDPTSDLVSGGIGFQNGVLRRIVVALGYPSKGAGHRELRATIPLGRITNRGR